MTKNTIIALAKAHHRHGEKLGIRAIINELRDLAFGDTAPGERGNPDVPVGAIETYLDAYKEAEIDASVIITTEEDSGTDEGCRYFVLVDDVLFQHFESGVEADAFAEGVRAGLRFAREAKKEEDDRAMAEERERNR